LKLGEDSQRIFDETVEQYLV